MRPLQTVKPLVSRGRYNSIPLATLKQNFPNLFAVEYDIDSPDLEELFAGFQDYDNSSSVITPSSGLALLGHYPAMTSLMLFIKGMNSSDKERVGSFLKKHQGVMFFGTSDQPDEFCQSSINRELEKQRPAWRFPLDAIIKYPLTTTACVSLVVAAALAYTYHGVWKEKYDQLHYHASPIIARLVSARSERDSAIATVKSLSGQVASNLSREDIFSLYTAEQALPSLLNEIQILERDAPMPWDVFSSYKKALRSAIGYCGIRLYALRSLALGLGYRPWIPSLLVVKPHDSSTAKAFRKTMSFRDLFKISFATDDCYFEFNDPDYLSRLNGWSYFMGDDGAEIGYRNIFPTREYDAMFARRREIAGKVAAVSLWTAGLGTALALAYTGR